MARGETEGADPWLADMPPTARQSWSAVAVAAVALIVFGGVVPFAGRPLAELNAFFPALDAIVFVTDLITSVLLFSQFSISRSRSLLILASGYLFTALIVIPHALTFSGAFSPTGLLGAGIQTGSWLFIFWHVGFAAALLAYAVLREEKRAKPISEASTLPAIGWSVASVFGLVCGFTWLATAGVTLLPPIVLDQTTISPLVIYPISFTMLISAACLAVLLVRRRSVLDQWLMVVALVLILELAFSGLLPAVRFSTGFYAGRAFSLVTSSIVLIAVLTETTWLYARLIHSNAMLRRERDNKLMNLEALAAAISHEVKQPLSSIELNLGSVLSFIDREPVDVEEARSALNDLISDSRRISEVLDNVRALFGKTGRVQEPIDVNEAVLGGLRILRGELRDHGVTVRVELASELPPVMGNRVQLQEVVLNLFHNAVEAMDAVRGDFRVLKAKTEYRDRKAVIIEVEDSGPGISPERAGSIFDAFVTTKPQGMGMGLALCRMIIERHEGHFSVWPAHPHGSIFRIILPQTNLPH